MTIPRIIINIPNVIASFVNGKDINTKYEIQFDVKIQRTIYRLKAGNIKRLKLHSEVISFPKSDEVQIEIKSIGLNFADVFAILGLYSATPKGSFIPGLEFSGVVLDQGENCERFKKGDKVMGVTRFGAYSSHINIDSRYIIKIPDQWSYEEGASYLVQVLTAYYGLKELGAIKHYQTVLIHSAAGGVGIWANRIAKKFNCYTIGTVGSEEKVPLLNLEGYDKGIVRNINSFESDLLRALDGRELHQIMECIGGKIMKVGFRHLSPTGRLLLYGSAHYSERKDRPNYLSLIPKYLKRPRIDAQSMIAENKSIMAFNLIYLFQNVELMHQLLVELEQLNLGKPKIGMSFKFENLPQAIRHFQSGKTIGKVVVNLS